MIVEHEAKFDLRQQIYKILRHQYKDSSNPNLFHYLSLQLYNETNFVFE